MNFELLGHKSTNIYAVSTRSVCTKYLELGTLIDLKLKLFIAVGEITLHGTCHKTYKKLHSLNFISKLYQTMLVGIILLLYNTRV